MTIKNDYVLREVSGTYVVVAVGKSSKDFKRIITLNDTGAFIFRLLKRDTSLADIKLAMVREYDIDATKVDLDVNQFINKMKENGIFE